MKAVLDACVLYPTVLREILLGVAARGLYEPVFSERILREWVLATAKLGPAAPAIAEGEAATLRAAFPRALIREQPQIDGRDVGEIKPLAPARPAIDGGGGSGTTGVVHRGIGNLQRKLGTGKRGGLQRRRRLCPGRRACPAQTGARTAEDESLDETPSRQIRRRGG